MEFLVYVLSVSPMRLSVTVFELNNIIYTTLCKTVVEILAHVSLSTFVDKFRRH